MSETKAEICLPTTDLRQDIPFFTKDLRMKMDMIYPADDPRVAVFSGHGIRVRLDQDIQSAAGALRILTENPRDFAQTQSLTAPGGTRVEIHPLNPPLVIPEVEHAFVVRRLADQAPWVIGRAGMQYRDLVPSRLGGAMIASHIRIAEAGPVGDMVHFHKVGFQLIFCVNGWVDVVYEDQGEPIRLTRGACFIQPPEIRHRVLFSGDDLEVLEIGVPAEHVTQIDHTLALPNGKGAPGREWDGQRFVHNDPAGATYTRFRLPGFEARDTTIAANTGNVAGVMVYRPDGSGAFDWVRHDAGIHFSFVMAGEMVLEGEGKAPFRLSRGDAFVTPPNMATRVRAPSDDLEVIEVTLPGAFASTLGEKKPG